MTRNVPSSKSADRLFNPPERTATPTLRSVGWGLHCALARRLDAGPGDRILVLGCGSGRELSLCLARGADKVVGLDPSLVKLMVAYRRNRAACLLRRLKLHRGGVEALRDISAPADKVLCVNSIDHLNDKVSALREIASLVTPGGRLVVASRQRRSARPVYVPGEDIRLAMIAAGWVGTRVEALPHGRGFCVCVTGHLPPGSGAVRSI